MPRKDSNIDSDKVGWRVNHWAASVGLGRAYTYQLIAEGRIKSVKIGTARTGGARIITTSPTEFLRSLAKGDDL